jgi:hypothetical protein
VEAQALSSLSLQWLRPKRRYDCSRWSQLLTLKFELDAAARLLLPLLHVACR